MYVCKCCGFNKKKYQNRYMDCNMFVICLERLKVRWDFYTLPFVDIVLSD